MLKIIGAYVLIYAWGLIGILYHTWLKASLDSISKRGAFAWADDVSIAVNLDRLFDRLFLDFVRYAATNFRVLGSSLAALALVVVAWAFMYAWGPLIDGWLTTAINVPLSLIGVKLSSSMFLASRKLGVIMVVVGYLIDSGWVNRQARAWAKARGLTTEKTPGDPAEG